MNYVVICGLSDSHLVYRAFKASNSFMVAKELEDDGSCWLIAMVHPSDEIEAASWLLTDDGLHKTPDSMSAI